MRGTLAVGVIALAIHGAHADAADPGKVLRIAFPIDVTGFDPAATQETYANAVEQRIYEPLYEWDYLARPYRMVPKLAVGMPEISSDGRVWIIHIRHGIYFTDDAAFGGKRRELTAADFVYSWKRLADPRVRSPSSDLVQRNVLGLDAAAAKASSTGKFDYDTEIPGLRAIDRYTLRLELIEPEYTLLDLLDASAFRPVAREVIEKYGDASGRAMRNPVGTGPYRLKEWQPGSRIVLEANSEYRDERFPRAPAQADAATRALAESMKDKRLPQIGRIEIAIIEETNPRMLMFNTGELDMMDIPADVAPKMIDTRGNLLPEYAARGVRLERALELAVTFTYFNMEDEVVGGYTADKVALRRAVCSAYSTDDDIRVLRNGQAVPASQPIPPDVVGHVQGYRSLVQYDPATARALLDKFGYRDRDGDGFRELPDGKPLTLHFGSLPGAAYRQIDALWQRSLAAVGLRVEFQVQNFPEAFKAAHAGKLQVASFGWSGDVAEDFVHLFYGPAAGGANLSRFRSLEYDALYASTHRTANVTERNGLYEKMTRLVSAQTPMCFGVNRYTNTAVAPRVRGYRKNVHYFVAPWEYLDLDRDVQAKARRN